MHLFINMFLIFKAAPAENWKQELFNESTTRLTNFVTLQTNALKVREFKKK